MNQPAKSSLPFAKSARRYVSDRPARTDGLLLSAAELFVSRTSHEQTEISVFQELAENLLPEASIGDRRRIAAMLARHPDTPKSLLLTLARDHDQLTAVPALRFTEKLPVDLLFNRIDEGIPVLQSAIAQRTHLSDSVISALCAKASPEAIRILLGRQDITLTQAHEAQLGVRAEISRLLAERMEHSESKPSDKAGDVPGHSLEKLGETVAAAELAAVVQRVRGKPGPASLSAGSGEASPEELHAAALKDDLTEFCRLLSQRLKVSGERVHDLVHTGSGQGLAVALKALRIGSRQATGILIRTQGIRLGLAETTELVRLHGTISIGAALEMVRTWEAGATKPPSSSRHQPAYQEARRPKERLRGSVQPEADVVFRKPSKGRFGS